MKDDVVGLTAGTEAAESERQMTVQAERFFLFFLFRNTLRFDLALGVRRRRAPKKMLLKNRPALGS